MLLSLLLIHPPPRSTLFPTRRSSDLSTSTTRHSRNSDRKAARPVPWPAGKSAPALEARESVASRCPRIRERSEEHTSELQSRGHLVCRPPLEKKTTETPSKVRRAATD